MKKILTAIICLAGILVGCSKKEAASYPPQEIVPLHDIFFSLRDAAPEDAAQIIAAHRTDIHTFLEVVCEGTPTDTLALGWAHGLVAESFTASADSVFPTLAPLEHTLGGILSRASEAGLDLPRRRYAAAVWGKSVAMGFHDSLMMIALNHYLGADHPAYEGWPVYVRAAKNPKFLPYDIAEALVANAYPMDKKISTEDNTLLTNILYDGALAYARLTLVPDAVPAYAAGYDPVRWQWLRDNEKRLWKTLVEKQLLYDTDPRTHARLLAPALSTPLLDNLAPGRVGRYLGLRMVQDYVAAHPGTTLPQLLSPEFYTSTEALESFSAK